MNLNLMDNINNDLKDDFLKKFKGELSKFLEENDKKPLIESILKENKLTTGNENAIIFKENEVLTKIAKEHGPFYFVKDDKKIYWSHNERKIDNDFYTVLKVDKEVEKLIIKKEDMPKDININDAYKMENGETKLDKIISNKVKSAIINMAKEIIEKQNSNLENNRIEGHLYKVTEEFENTRFLQDITAGKGVSFEEVDLPEEILEKAVEGTVLKFTNGKYEIN